MWSRQIGVCATLAAHDSFIHHTLTCTYHGILLISQSPIHAVNHKLTTSHRKWTHTYSTRCIHHCMVIHTQTDCTWTSHDVHKAGSASVCVGLPVAATAWLGRAMLWSSLIFFFNLKYLNPAPCTRAAAPVRQQEQQHRPKIYYHGLTQIKIPPHY